MRKSDAYRDCNGHIHANSDGNGDGNCYSYCYSEPNGHVHANSDSNRNSDGYRYGYGYSNSNCYTDGDTIAAANADATTASNARAASNVCANDDSHESDADANSCLYADINSSGDRDAGCVAS